jgi:hypothetical protein
LESIDEGLDLWSRGRHGAKYLAHGEIIVVRNLHRNI